MNTKDKIWFKFKKKLNKHYLYCLQERNHPIHNIYANYQDAIEGLMILEDNSNPDNYFCIDKNNEIYKIYDSSEDLVKIYDYENDCIIDEISYEDLSRN